MNPPEVDNAPKNLFDVLSLNQLVRKMPIRVIRLGLESFRKGKVSHLDLRGNSALAYVQGTERYQCSVDVFTGNLRGICSCPAYPRSGHCKHIAAMSFAILDLM